ncbi:MAG: hypothetical protein QM679_04790 [Patulibacter sp.]
MDSAAPVPRPRRPLLSAVVAIAAIVLLLRFLYGPGIVGIDALWSLAWGRDLAHGAALSVSGTTTPHVLSNLLGLVLAPFGPDADRALVAVEYVGAATLIWSCGAVAWQLAGLPAGALAAILMLSREQLLYATRSGFLDVLAATLVALAAYFVVRGQARRWTGAAALLALAGLLRPEPWVLLAVLTLWCWQHSGRPDWRLVAMTVAVPLLWALSDGLLAGDPLFSLHETGRVSHLFRIGQGIPDTAGAQLSSIPRSIVRACGPELLLVAVLAAATLWRPGPGGADERTRWFGGADGPLVTSLRLLTAGAAVLAATLAGQALTGTLLFARFSLPFAALIVPVSAVVIVTALRERFAVSATAGVVVIAPILVAFALPLAIHARADTDAEQARYEAARAAIRPGVPCVPAVVPGRNLRAAVAAWTGHRATAVVAAADAGIPPRGTYIDAVTRSAERFALDPSFPQRRLAALDLPLVRSGHGWIVRAQCGR